MSISQGKAKVGVGEGPQLSRTAYAKVLWQRGPSQQSPEGLKIAIAREQEGTHSVLILYGCCFKAGAFPNLFIP